jgi:hypothetical protein
MEARTVPSTLTIDANGNLAYTASAGVANDLTISLSGGTYTFNDTTEDITVSGPGSGGCTGSGSHTVTCPAAALSSISVDLRVEFFAKLSSPALGF